MKLYVQNNYVADLAIDGEVGNFETSVKYFTVDQGSEVCTLSCTPGKNYGWYTKTILTFCVLTVIYIIWTLRKHIGK